ncbi:DNA adenine methylase [Aquimarina algiphila]|uniref:site-specific DNA-methyltransferase (adenine-specific) n=2 Tax=Aquimarina algiphila TaxID=2047982 RepID=A0A554VFP6_9FLAO|nr:DNA adenine methylase [Aquimarina algiphila]
MTKMYTTAPLPFQGQKQNFIKQFKEELSKQRAPALYVDLFGGSGLLSRTAKDIHPEATVVYNDYDNFRERLQAIPKTNELLADIRVLVEGIANKSRIDNDIKTQIIDRIAQEKGYIDYITISSNVLFSQNYANSIEALKKESFYNRVRKSDITLADDYLDGLEIVSIDYKQLFEMYKNHEHVVFLVDPPYLSTDCTTYKNYWRLKDYLDVLRVLIGQKYFYFTSNKSSIVELCEWIETNTGGVNPFYEATIVERKTNINHQSSYTDIMLFKWTTTTT